MLGWSQWQDKVAHAVKSTSYVGKLDTSDAASVMLRLENNNTVGISLCILLGMSLGTSLGKSLGTSLGASLGIRLGASLGMLLGGPGATVKGDG
jgi:hypothetical protein